MQNFPIIPGPSIDDEFDKKWFVKQCKETLKLFKHVLEFTSQLLCKIMRMLRQFWRFSVGIAELAWDFQREPISQ